MVEWRTESKAFEKSKEINVTELFVDRRSVTAWRMEIKAAVVEPVGRMEQRPGQ